jgi:hypothetical protein
VRSAGSRYAHHIASLAGEPPRRPRVIESSVFWPRPPSRPAVDITRSGTGTSAGARTVAHLEAHVSMARATVAASGPPTEPSHQPPTAAAGQPEFVAYEGVTVDPAVERHADGRELLAGYFAAGVTHRSTGPSRTDGARGRDARLTAESGYFSATTRMGGLRARLCRANG